MDELVLDCQTKMNKSVDALLSNLATLRTGRASAAVLDKIEIDYYGSMTPINQLSSISVPEPRQLLIKPYDKNDLKAIVAALNASDLGINPINDGTQIRLVFPALTEDTRRDLVKVAKKYAEDNKVAIRNIRREYLDLVKEDKDIPEDMGKKLEADIQKVTDEAVKKIDEVVANKEKEIMSL
ncbi:MAG: ribosome recycling factor [Bacilli bacterium]|nr:ribosome recycling factor [Bacilli bacterium]